MRAGFAESARRQREQAEKANLERVEYEALERPWLEDPDGEIPLLGGLQDGDVCGPRFCDCARGCGCNTWPIRFRYDPALSGEYVLAYVWCEGGLR